MSSRKQKRKGAAEEPTRRVLPRRTASTQQRNKESATPCSSPALASTSAATSAPVRMLLQAQTSETAKASDADPFLSVNVEAVRARVRQAHEKPANLALLQPVLAESQGDSESESDNDASSSKAAAAKKSWVEKRALFLKMLGVGFDRPRSHRF